MKTLYRAVLAQAAVMTAVAVVGIARALNVHCAGTPGACEDLSDFSRRIAVVALVGLILVYGIISAVAFFAWRRASKTLTGLLFVIEVLFVVGSVLSITSSNGEAGPLLSGLAGLVTGGICALLAGRALVPTPH